MREIKFRAWHKKLKIWLDEIEIYNDGSWRGSLNNVWGYDKRECKLMQYTGLKDKNGKEIYEGDFLSGEIYGQSGRIEPLKVEIPSVYWLQEGGIFQENETKIIGNIYENPELLKSKEK